MRELKELLKDINYAFFSLRRAKNGIEVPELHAIFIWFEDSRVKLHYHLTRAPTEDSEEELTCITGQVMSDYELHCVDEYWGTDIPEERENMIMWVIKPEQE